MTSLGHCDGVRVTTDVAKSPKSPEVARWLRHAHSNGCQYAVLEANSEALAEHRLAGVQLEAAVVTNVRRAHVDMHGSVLNYRRIKARLFDHLKESGFAVINADDPASKFYLSQIVHPTITFGINAAAEVNATLLEVYHGEQTVLLTAGNDSIPLQTSVIGTQHIYHCLAAAAVGLVCGLDLETIVRGLEALKTIPGRIERMASTAPFATYIDASPTADALANTLNSLRRATDGRLICVIGPPMGGSADDLAAIGRVAERYADVTVLTRGTPADAQPLESAHAILDGFDRPAIAHVLPNRARAIGWALNQASEGDTVLVAGCGRESIEMADGQTSSLDDRQMVRFFLDDLEKRAREKQEFARGFEG